jgi:hypothetical protein
MGSQESGGTRKPGMKKKWQLGAVFQQLEGSLQTRAPRVDCA